MSVCTHTRQVENQRCSRTGRVQKTYNILRKNTIFNEHPVTSKNRKPSHLCASFWPRKTLNSVRNIFLDDLVGQPGGGGREMVTYRGLEAVQGRVVHGRAVFGCRLEGREKWRNGRMSCW